MSDGRAANGRFVARLAFGVAVAAGMVVAVLVWRWPAGDAPARERAGQPLQGGASHASAGTAGAPSSRALPRRLPSARAATPVAPTGEQDPTAVATSFGGVPLSALGPANPFSAIKLTVGEADAIISLFEDVADRVYELDEQEMRGDLTSEQHREALRELMAGVEDPIVRILGRDRRDEFMRAAQAWAAPMMKDPGKWKQLFDDLGSASGPDPRIVRIGHKLLHQPPPPADGVQERTPE